MAELAFPDIAKRLTLPNFHGHTYSYAHCPPFNPVLPTIVFLHGFPSSCYDWRHQIHYFRARGYGIMAPDLLGYGGTSKPLDLESYRLATMIWELLELLNYEEIAVFHVVGHGMGCRLASRLANYFPNRLLSCTFVNTTYSVPGIPCDVEVQGAAMRLLSGRDIFGAWEFFARNDAGSLIDQHAGAFFNLYYTQWPELWLDHLCPTGALEKWLCADGWAPYPEYISMRECELHHLIAQGSHRSALMWHKARMSNMDVPDEIEAGLDPLLSVPVLMFASQRTELEVVDHEEHIRKYASDCIFDRSSTRGWWVHLEAKEETNKTMEFFFMSLLPQN